MLYNRILLQIIGKSIANLEQVEILAHSRFQEYVKPHLRSPGLGSGFITGVRLRSAYFPPAHVWLHRRFAAESPASPSSAGEKTLDLGPTIPVMKPLIVYFNTPVIKNKIALRESSAGKRLCLYMELDRKMCAAVKAVFMRAVMAHLRLKARRLGDPLPFHSFRVGQCYTASVQEKVGLGEKQRA